jgi:hypothetical protein
MSTTFSAKRAAVRKRRPRVAGHLGQVVFPAKRVRVAAREEE